MRSSRAGRSAAGPQSVTPPSPPHPTATRGTSTVGCGRPQRGRVRRGAGGKKNAHQKRLTRAPHHLLGLCVAPLGQPQMGHPHRRLHPHSPEAAAQGGRRPQRRLSRRVVRRRRGRPAAAGLPLRLGHGQVHLCHRATGGTQLAEGVGAVGVGGPQGGGGGKRSRPLARAGGAKTAGWPHGLR